MKCIAYLCTMHINNILHDVTKKMIDLIFNQMVSTVCLLWCKMSTT